MPPSDLRVTTCSFTAMSGPAAGSRMRCGAAVRMSLSPRYARAERSMATCASFVKSLSISHEERQVLAGEVGVLLAAREGELLLDDLLRQHEPRVVVTGLPEVRERAERVEAGEERHGQARARGIQPDRRRAGQDADAVARPDRIPVLDAFDVVPHAVAVDQTRPRRRGDGLHRPVDVGGDPGDHVLRRSAESRRPLPAHEVVVAADAAGRDDGGRRRDLELADHLARARGAPLGVGVGQYVAGGARDGPVRGRQRGDEAVRGGARRCAQVVSGWTVSDGDAAGRAGPMPLGSNVFTIANAARSR